MIVHGIKRFSLLGLFWGHFRLFSKLGILVPIFPSPLGAQKQTSVWFSVKNVMNRFGQLGRFGHISILNRSVNNSGIPPWRLRILLRSLLGNISRRSARASSSHFIYLVSRNWCFQSCGNSSLFQFFILFLFRVEFKIESYFLCRILGFSTGNLTESYAYTFRISVSPMNRCYVFYRYTYLFIFKTFFMNSREGGRRRER